MVESVYIGGVTEKEHGAEDEEDIKRQVVVDDLERRGADPLLFRAVASPPASEPEPTLQDARALFRKGRLEKNSGRNPENRLERGCSRRAEALGPLESIPLSSLRRQHGRALRDHMLSVKKADGSVTIIS